MSRLCGFSKQRQLGKGTYGAVYLLSDAQGQDLAGKLADGASLSEIDIMSRLRHPHLVPSMGVRSQLNCADLDEDEYLLLMPAYTFSLDVALASPLFAEEYRARAAHQLAAALAALHGAGYLHLDIKAANVLVRSVGGHFDAALGDFGLAQNALVDETENAITYHYRAPEYGNPAVRGMSWRSGPQLDVWALGVVFLELFAQRDVLSLAPPPPAFASGDWTDKEHAEYLRKHALQLARPDRIDALVSGVSAARRRPLADLLKRMLSADPLARPDAAAVAQDPLFRGMAPLPLAAQELQAPLRLEALAAKVGAALGELAPELEKLEDLGTGHQSSLAYILGAAADLVYRNNRLLLNEDPRAFASVCVRAARAAFMGAPFVAISDDDLRLFHLLLEASQGRLAGNPLYRRVAAVSSPSGRLAAMQREIEQLAADPARYSR